MDTYSKPNALTVSAAPAELILLLSVCTQSFLSGFALIPPWAMQECRPFRAHVRFSPPINYFVVLMRLPWGSSMTDNKQFLFII